jgi:hypothetical protein
MTSSSPISPLMRPARELWLLPVLVLVLVLVTEVEVEVEVEFPRMIL